MENKQEWRERDPNTPNLSTVKAGTNQGSETLICFNWHSQGEEIPHDIRGTWVKDVCHYYHPMNEICKCKVEEVSAMSWKVAQCVCRVALIYINHYSWLTANSHWAASSINKSHLISCYHITLITHYNYCTIALHNQFTILGEWMSADQRLCSLMLRRW